ncbi:MAG: type II toxin-antitoxin system VapC family toxin [Candidatus Hodarchaeota archaeon]
MPILDSDVIIQFLRGNNEAKEKVKELKEKYKILKTTALNVAELYLGANLSNNVPKNTRLIEAFLKTLDLISFSPDDGKVYGQISAELQLKGLKIGITDEMIASIALHSGEPIVTRNVKHFNKISQLKIEKW